MFARKNKDPFQVAILTPDYLVEGENDPKDENDIFNDGVRFNFGNIQNDGHLYGGIFMQSVKVSPTRWAGGTLTFNKWKVGGADTVVVIVPRDTVALAACQETFKDSSKVGHGVILAGTYMIRGNVMIEGDNEGKGIILSDAGYFTIENATISSQASGRMEDIHADLIVVNGKFVDGYNLD